MSEEWAPPSDGALTEGKPIRDIDMRAIRDLTAAAFRGAPGAPRLSPWGVVSTVEAGTTLRYFEPGIWYFPADAQNDRRQIAGVQVMCYGSVRVDVEHAGTGSSSGAPNLQVVRQRGNVQTSIQDWDRANTSFQARDVNVTDLEPGDSIILLSRTSANWGHRVRNFSLSTDGGFLWAIGPGSLVMGAVPT